MMAKFGGLPTLSESEQDEENSPPAKKRRVAVYFTYKKTKEFDNLQYAAELYQIGWFCMVSSESDFFRFILAAFTFAEFSLFFV